MSLAGEDLLPRALRAHREGKLVIADKLYRRILEITPGDVSASQLLGVVRAQQRRFTEAEPLLLRAATADPANPDAQNNLGNVLLELGRPVEAIEQFRRAIALRPQFADAHYNLGNALRRVEQPDAAIAAYRAAIDSGRTIATRCSISPSSCAEPRSLRPPSSIWKACWRSIRATAACTPCSPSCCTRRAFGRSPDAFRSRAGLEPEAGRGPLQPGPHDDRQARRSAASGDARAAGPRQGFGEADRSLLRMALGKAYEDLGRYDEAFENFREGKRLKRKLVPFDEAAMAAQFEALHRVLALPCWRATRASLPAARNRSCRSSCSASRARARPWWSRSWRAIPKSTARASSDIWTMSRRPSAPPPPPASAFPTICPISTPPESRALGEAYVERLRSLEPAGPRITDKLPENYLNIGLIHLILPRARIIHVRRDPLDVCVSCFSINFSGGLTYTSDLGELGRTYRRYLELMAHWRRLLPPGAMLEVQYEEVVDDLEGQARRLIEYCGLAWNPRCLEFHETRAWCALPASTRSVSRSTAPLCSAGGAMNGIWGR